MLYISNMLMQGHVLRCRMSGWLACHSCKAPSVVGTSTSQRSACLPDHPTKHSRETQRQRITSSWAGPLSGNPPPSTANPRASMLLNCYPALSTATPALKPVQALASLHTQLHSCPPSPPAAYCAPRAALVMSTIASLMALRSSAGLGKGRRSLSTAPLRLTSPFMPRRSRSVSATLSTPLRPV